MGFKDLIVIFTDPHGSANRLNIAVETARPGNAHLIGLYLVPPITLLAGGLPDASSCPMRGASTPPVAASAWPGTRHGRQRAP
jgi:hypothetical protein